MRFTFLSITLFALLPFTFAQQTQVIAHRGYWKIEGSAQNSLKSITLADKIGCYGSELDVWLTADNQLVVDHDQTFKGVTMQDATAKVCAAVVLNNGEQLPTLQQYLKRAKKLKTQIILELKPHRTPEQETKAAELIVEMVQKMGLEKRVEYITFSLHATKELIRLAPNAPVFYLNGELTPQQLKELGCAGPDYHYNVFRKHPEWIQQCHDLGMKVNVWTIDNKEDLQSFIDQHVDFITTNEPVVLNQLLGK